MNKIWNFKENEAVECDGIDMKTYKPTGKFYDDVEVLCRMFNLRVHPAMKPVVNLRPDGERVEEEKPKDLNTLNFYKHRLDKNSMKVLFLALQSAPYIHTLKYLSFQLTSLGFPITALHMPYSQHSSITCAKTVRSINPKDVACNILHLFFDWNALYENDYSTSGKQQLYQRKTPEEVCLYAKL